MHDSNLWGHTTIGQFCELGKLTPYALVGDVTYFPCPWMFLPFKRHKYGISKYIYYWNYIQINTRMCIKRSFGLLKGHWRILLKRLNVHL